MRAALTRALNHTKQGLQSLKGSPKYSLRRLSLTSSCHAFAPIFVAFCRDLYIVYAINACDNFNYFSLSLLFTLYLTEEFGFSDQQVCGQVKCCNMHICVIGMHACRAGKAVMFCRAHSAIMCRLGCCMAFGAVQSPYLALHLGE